MERVSQRKISKKQTRRIDEDYHLVKSIEFIGSEMVLRVDSKQYRFKLQDISYKLLNASKKEREAYRIICSGYGINWPLIDEDLSIDGLIKTYSKNKN